MQTERLLLRRWEDSDAEALFKYASDPDVGTRAGWPPHQSLEDSLTVIREIFQRDTMWAIVLKDTNEPIGSIGYLTRAESNLSLIHI